MCNANGFWDLMPSGSFEMVAKRNSIDILGIYIYIIDNSTRHAISILRADHGESFFWEGV